MTGETADDQSGFTTDTLKVLVDQRFADLRTLLDERYATQTKALDAAFVAAEKAVATALDSAKEAVNKAESASEKRFESVNEFRAQLADQNATFITRVEFDAKIDSLEKQVDDLKGYTDRAQGRAGGLAALYGWMIAGVGAVVAVATLIIILTR